MGHDIEIRSCGRKGKVLDNTGISFNFSGFDPSIHDLHGQPGRIIAPYLRRELEKMKVECGVEPNTELGVDGYGTYTEKSPLCNGYAIVANDAWRDFHDNIPKVVYAIRCMHAFHLHRFMLLAQKYPNGYWYSDQCGSSSELNGHLSSDESSVDSSFDYINYVDDDDDEDDSDDTSGSRPPYVISLEKSRQLSNLRGVKEYGGVAYYCGHPTKGRILVATPEDAMDISRAAALTGNSSAIDWTRLALMLK